MFSSEVLQVGKKIKDWKIEQENESNIRSSSGEISEAGKHVYKGWPSVEHNEM